MERDGEMILLKDGMRGTMAGKAPSPKLRFLADISRSV